MLRGRLVTAASRRGVFRIWRAVRRDKAACEDANKVHKGPNAGDTAENEENSGKGHGPARVPAPVYRVIRGGDVDAVADDGGNEAGGLDAANFFVAQIVAVRAGAAKEKASSAATTLERDPIFCPPLFAAPGCGAASSSVSSSCTGAVSACAAPASAFSATQISSRAACRADCI